MVLMKNGDVEIAGSSPETLVKVSGRKATAMPIAGNKAARNNGRSRL